ncbi:prion-inhibition and propagation domain-containing protein [Trichoderma compactum]
MSQPLGIVSEAIQMATAFSACVEVFDHVQLSRRFGKDFQTNQLKLTLLKLRLSRWGAAVDIYSDPQLGNSTATKDDVETAKDTLLQILLLFEDSKTISDKYKLKAAKNEAVEGQHPNTDLTEDMGVTSDISGLVESLEQLFPPQPPMQSRLVGHEVSEAQDEREMAALATSAQGIDQVLFAAAGQKIAGEDRSIFNGNTFSRDYGGATHAGPAHMYDGITIKDTKGLRVHNGGQDGGNDFFNRDELDKSLFVTL